MAGERVEQRITQIRATQELLGKRIELLEEFIRTAPAKYTGDTQLTPEQLEIWEATGAKFAETASQIKGDRLISSNDIVQERSRHEPETGEN